MEQGPAVSALLVGSGVACRPSGRLLRLVNAASPLVGSPGNQPLHALPSLQGGSRVVCLAAPQPQTQASASGSPAHWPRHRGGGDWSSPPSPPGAASPPVVRRSQVAPLASDGASFFPARLHPTAVGCGSTDLPLIHSRSAPNCEAKQHYAAPQRSANTTRNSAIKQNN